MKGLLYDRGMLQEDFSRTVLSKPENLEQVIGIESADIIQLNWPSRKLAWPESIDTF